MLLRELVAKRERIVTVAPEDTTRFAAQTMADADVGCTAVTAGDRLVGILTERDLVRRLLLAGLDADTTPVSAVMTSEVLVGKADAHIATAARTMQQHHVRHLPIVDDAERLLGVISIRDLLREEIRDIRDYIAQKEG